MAQPYVRVDVWTLAEDDPIITAYADAVAAMQRKSSDATRWLPEVSIRCGSTC